MSFSLFMLFENGLVGLDDGLLWAPGFTISYNDRNFRRRNASNRFLSLQYLLLI